MKVMLDIFLTFLIIMVNLFIFYAMYLTICDYMDRMENEINNKSIKKRLHDPEELSNIFENLRGR